MNIALWVFLIVFYVYWIFMGITHFTFPEGLPAIMSWMYDRSPFLHYFCGTAEILGGLGLILPSLTRIRPKLAPLAGASLVLVMLGGAVWHSTRGEVINIGGNLFLAAPVVFIAYGCWFLEPISGRNRSGESVPNRNLLRV